MADETQKIKKVLIIEDDNFLGDLLLDHVTKSGINASLCRDAETALESIKKDPPALLLTDLLLPGMDGYALLRKLKELNILSQISVIVLSNLSQTEKIQEGIDLGVKDFLGKSNFDLDDITKKLKDELEKIT
ncbi:MAG: response regulator [Candidatus Paceibacterota bacterium]|jgi:two-component system response regulator (stage 0 sporulation protein F)|nr:response regulator [Candidatus Paceibacterota bacterium]